MNKHRPTKDEYFIKMLDLVASRSTCMRRQVAAIIVSDRGHVLATGYNGVPRSFPHCIDYPCEGAGDASGNSERCLAVHAEINALLQCCDMTSAHTIYTSVSPCFNCAKAIINTPISHVVCTERYVDPRGTKLLQESGINLVCKS